MPKMRGFKPEIWTDDKFVELSPFARLLFMGMWNYACDNGHLDDKPKQIKMRVLPTDDVNAADLINEMLELGMVRRDDAGLSIPKLRDHQRLDNRYFTWCDRCSLDEIPEPARSKHPALTTGTRSAHDVSTTSAHVVTREGRKEGSREGDGEGEGRKEGSGARKRALPEDFRPSQAHVDLAASLGVDLRGEWPQFVDHHKSRGNTMKDWDAALRTWIRNAKKFGGAKPTLAVVTDPSQLPPVEESWMRRKR